MTRKLGSAPKQKGYYINRNLKVLIRDQNVPTMLSLKIKEDEIAFASLKEGTSKHANRN